MHTQTPTLWAGQLCHIPRGDASPPCWLVAARPAPLVTSEGTRALLECKEQPGCQKTLVLVPTLLLTAA